MEWRWVGCILFFAAGRLAQAGMKRPWASQSMKKDGAFEEMLSRLWFDTHLNDDRALALLTQVVGPDRLVFGTNFAGWDQPEDGHHGAVPPALAGNARRLLRKDRDRNDKAHNGGTP